MVKVNKTASLILATVLVFCASAGCTAGGGGSKDNGNEKPIDRQEPVTLTFYSMPAFKLDQIQTHIIEPVRKKFPHITIEVVDNTSGKKIDEVVNQFVTANAIPDFMLTNYSTVRTLKSLGIAFDLSSLIKGNKVDVAKFMPRAIEYLKLYSEQNELYSLPFFINVNTMSYNKDIFDKFGVAYPRDGMTWEEISDLAKNLTRSVDGVDYLGVNPNRPYVIAPQLSLDVIDPKTGKAAVNNDGWKRVFQLFQNIYSIPGNVPKNQNDFWGAKNSFYRNQNLAMNLLWWDQTVGGLQELQNGNKEFKWDLITVPIFAEKPKMGQWLDQFDMTISSQSKHKEVAFQVIDYLTSAEYQMELSKNGYISSLNYPAIKEQLGANLPFLKGKNVQALFKMDYSKPLSRLNFDVNELMNPFYVGMVYNNKDVNTTLRELEEKLNQAIQESGR
ncbi:ABC transporter substrate-binding protein [Paenibacillus allorhizosphaerae]|uniref:Extracellular solute-binding protein n=1 Tax=Paenibacillus allorhizosphaerae TaxID=2849866 RepID=A0ABM8VR02_9BACL|nr:extracellular solute-binding protein [Paenibacillus allorhizosphaerae]CAG7654830.1 hypothetical protein PAECIP111802_05897 [Paenibacillus allorhizosphaerae]